MEYNNALNQDKETKKILDRIYGQEKWSALDTAERRACWRVGYETQETGGKFSNPDSDSEKFHPWRALHPVMATKNDNFFRALGASMKHGG